jgi:hypothetical protein
MAACRAQQAPKEWYFYPHGYNPDSGSGSSAASAAAAAAAQPSPGAHAASTTDTSGGGGGGGYQLSPDEAVPGPDASGRAGPLSKSALRQLAAQGVITSATWVVAAGMASPAPLARVRELRWMLAQGLGLLGPFDAALVALQVRVLVCACLVWGVCAGGGGEGAAVKAQQTRRAAGVNW